MSEMGYLTPIFPTIKNDFYHIDISPATTLATIRKIMRIRALTGGFAV